MNINVEDLLRTIGLLYVQLEAANRQLNAKKASDQTADSPGPAS